MGLHFHNWGVNKLGLRPGGSEGAADAGFQIEPLFEPASLPALTVGFGWDGGSLTGIQVDVSIENFLVPLRELELLLANGGAVEMRESTGGGTRATGAPTRLLKGAQAHE